MLEVNCKLNSTPQNWFVRWGLHLTYILWNCLISSHVELPTKWYGKKKKW